MVRLVEGCLSIRRVRVGARVRVRARVGVRTRVRVRVRVRVGVFVAGVDVRRFRV